VSDRVASYLIAVPIGLIAAAVVSPGVAAVLAVLALAGVWTYLDRRRSR
jgi:hypothetical protein